MELLFVNPLQSSIKKHAKIAHAHQLVFHASLLQHAMSAHSEELNIRMETVDLVQQHAEDVLAQMETGFAMTQLLFAKTTVFTSLLQPPFPTLQAKQTILIKHQSPQE